MMRNIPPALHAALSLHARWLNYETRESGKLLELPNADLRDLDLCGRDLSPTLLPEARFDRSLLRNARLNDARPNQESFVEAILDGTWMVKTNAEQADFSQASMRGMRMVGMDLNQANMQGTDLTGSNLYDAWVADANLEGANLTHADLREAWLKGRAVGSCHAYRSVRSWGDVAWSNGA